MSRSIRGGNRTDTSMPVTWLTGEVLARRGDRPAIIGTM
jgi:hypothetical protein